MADGAGGESGIGGVIIHIQILRQPVGFAKAVHSASDGVLGTRHLTGDLRNGCMRLQEGTKEIILLVRPERSSLLEHQALLTRDLNGTSGIGALRHEVCQLRTGKIKRLPYPGVINLGERLTEELLQIDVETGQLARNGMDNILRKMRIRVSELEQLVSCGQPRCTREFEKHEVLGDTHLIEKQITRLPDARILDEDFAIRRGRIRELLGTYVVSSMRQDPLEMGLRVVATDKNDAIKPIGGDMLRREFGEDVVDRLVDPLRLEVEETSRILDDLGLVLGIADLIIINQIEVVVVGEEMGCRDLAFGPIEMLMPPVGFDLDVAISFQRIGRIERQDVVAHGDIAVGIVDDILVEILRQAFALVGENEALALGAHVSRSGLFVEELILGHRIMGN